MVHTFQAPTTFALDNQNHMASSPKTGQGYLSGPGLHEYPVTYAVVDGIALHAGCIDLGPAEAVEAEAVRIRESHQKRQADLISEALPITTAVEDIQRGIGCRPTLLTSGPMASFLTPSPAAYQIKAESTMQLSIFRKRLPFGLFGVLIAMHRAIATILKSLAMAIKAGALPALVCAADDNMCAFQIAILGRF